MENNDYNEDSTEETQDTASSAEQTEETNQGEEDTKDWKAEALKFKAIAERKDKKLQEKSQGETINKPNTEQSGPTMEDMMLVNKGLNLEEIKIVKEASKVLGISALDAHDNDFVQQKLNQGRQEKQAKANTLPPSSGSAPAPRAKEVKNMTDDEHQQAFANAIKNL